jgi:aspartate dehydrogenase
MSGELRVAVVGFGAIGRTLVGLIRRELPMVTLVGIAKRSPASADDAALAPAGATFLKTPRELMAARPQVVVECAGHDALTEFGPSALEQGADLLVASVGALADPELEFLLRRKARSSGARVLIPSGALGGLDVLSAARFARLETVQYVGRKPHHAWIGTAAEHLLGLDDPGSDVLIFEGTARQAARDFPKNANVTAAVAIAGLGFDLTQVELHAVSGPSPNEHSVRAQGDFGSFEITVRATALADNPKTSMLAPCSIARCLSNLRQAIALA